MLKRLLSGNEAIARGAYENGVSFAAGYPGTPATEIVEEIAKYNRIDAQWSVNEKVALDVAVGASLGGARTLVAMKHVGLNVASDTLFTLSYTGVNGGLVIVTADDPGMHSSQNEQDNRFYAKFAKIPLLEPSDSQEAKDFVGLGLSISEIFDTPVLIRITTAIAHSKSIVKFNIKQKTNFHNKTFRKDSAKWVMIPANARKRRLLVEARLKKLKNFSERIWCNRIEWGKRNIGIITSSICYQYAKEALSDASILKLGMTYPLPEFLIKKFASKIQDLYVIEELDPFLEEQVKVLGIELKGKELFPQTGELSPSLVKDKISIRGSQNKVSSTETIEKFPPRVPSLCPGCPYLGFFYTLKKLKLFVAGDIGCYALGALPPASAMHTCISMGSSIGIALGLEKAMKDRIKHKLIAVIGDSTFLHAGIPELIDVVYNKGSVTIIIFDNQTIAMTGRQDHPGTGVTLKKESSRRFDYVKLIRALGVKNVQVVNIYDLKATKKAILEETNRDSVSVVVAKGPCILLDKYKNRKRLFKVVNSENCRKCHECLNLGCAAITIKEKGRIEIDAELCIGCSICAQLCRYNAIEKYAPR